MTNTENTALQMIAEAARCPDYGPDMVKTLMKKKSQIADLQKLTLRLNGDWSI